MNYQQIIFKVRGMSCSGCENAVSRALKSVPGVISARASNLENQAWVEFDPSRVSIIALKEAISQAGYKVS